MTNPETKQLITIYTEATPNPETIKFVLNKLLLLNDSVDYPNEISAQDSPLAKELFGFPFVKGVFIASNFVTVAKTPDTEWLDIMSTIREFIKEYVSEEKPIFSESFLTNKKVEDDGTDSETKIKEILEKYVRPAVEMDGGAIIFKSFENGLVTLQLQGACSGCPSASVTLKAGIEGMLKRMLPDDVMGVIAEEI